jgi:hypothetical protein
MQVPVKTRAPLRLRSILSLILLGLTATHLLARGPEPTARIPLQEVGFLPVSPQFLLAGSSMLTLHYVDDKHLLVTFNSKRLLKRIPNDPPEDQDRNVDAVLLEIPSGHILARTGWRLHDHGQYLWSLGHGRFLLRVRDTLTTFAPLANLPTGQPFLERPFIESKRRIEALLLSPDADLLILETVDRPAVVLPSDTQEQPDNGPKSVQINFFRVASEGSDGVRLRPAGEGRARVPGRIPATAAGYLALLDQGRDHWAFDFNSYAGKVSELSPFDSSCRPFPLFVTRSEFIAFGCHGGRAQQIVGGFNLRGEEMWEQNIYDSYVAPFLVFAPASGRFALSRLITHGTGSMMDPPIPELFGPQTIVVYQIESGKQLLRVESQPIQRAGQNFALSPDGLNLAVFHVDEIDIYSLPPLTSKDQAAVKEAQLMAPPETDAPVSLSRSVAASPTSSEADSPPSVSQPPASLPTSVNTGNAQPTPPPPNPNAPAPPADPPAVADPPAAQPEQQPRKPPSLYAPEAPQPSAPPAESPK